MGVFNRWPFYELVTRSKEPLTCCSFYPAADFCVSGRERVFSLSETRHRAGTFQSKDRSVVAVVVAVVVVVVGRNVVVRSVVFIAEITVNGRSLTAVDGQRCQVESCVCVCQHVLVDIYTVQLSDCVLTPEEVGHILAAELAFTSFLFFFFCGN